MQRAPNPSALCLTKSLDRLVSRPTRSAAPAATKTVLTVQHAVDTMTTYLHEMHETFDRVKVGDNPELTAEGEDLALFNGNPKPMDVM